MRTLLYLLRHARSAPRPELDAAAYPLAPEGEIQAAGLVPPLSRLGITHVHSSPWPRALETCRPFAAAAGLEVRLDEDLRERAIASTWLEDFAGFVYDLQMQGFGTRFRDSVFEQGKTNLDHARTGSAIGVGGRPRRV